MATRKATKPAAKSKAPKRAMKKQPKKTADVDSIIKSDGVDSGQDPDKVMKALQASGTALAKNAGLKFPADEEAFIFAATQEVTFRPRSPEEARTMTFARQISGKMSDKEMEMICRIKGLSWHGLSRGEMLLLKAGLFNDPLWLQMKQGLRGVVSGESPRGQQSAGELRGLAATKPLTTRQRKQKRIDLVRELCQVHSLIGQGAKLRDMANADPGIVSLELPPLKKDNVRKICEPLARRRGKTRGKSPRKIPRQ